MSYPGEPDDRQELQSDLPRVLGQDDPFKDPVDRQSPGGNPAPRRKNLRMPVTIERTFEKFKRSFDYWAGCRALAASCGVLVEPDRQLPSLSTQSLHR